MFTCCLVLAASCTGPGPRTETQRGPAQGGNRLGAPSWAGEQLGWAKLNHIELWLATDTHRYDPFWRVQGELILSEGRVSFAERDLAAGSISPTTLTERAGLARQGFERVLADGDANAAQRARAERGLVQLGDWAAPVAPSSGLAVLPRGAWRASAPIVSRLDPAGGNYTRITVHHSDAVPGARLDGSYADSSEALRRIQNQHVQGRGYGDIGYHFLIDASGRVFEGRALAYQGAHARGGNNVQNLGVCMLGDFQHRAPGPEALAGLERLLDQLCAQYRIPRARVFSHRDFTNTLCPGEPLAQWVKAYGRGAGPGLASNRHEHSSASAHTQPATPRAQAAPATWPRPVASQDGGGKVR